MENKLITEHHFWVIAIREAYDLELINEEEYIAMHNTTYLDSNSKMNNEAIDFIINNIMQDSELLVPAIREDIALISNNIIPSKLSFKKYMLSFLIDSLNNLLIDNIQYDNYLKSFNYSNSEWSEKELEIANELIDNKRYLIIKNNTTAINYMNHISFNLLMKINGMS
jgi:hypothetical protein